MHVHMKKNLPQISVNSRNKAEAELHMCLGVNLLKSQDLHFIFQFNFTLNIEACNPNIIISYMIL